MRNLSHGLGAAEIPPVVDFAITRYFDTDRWRVVSAGGSVETENIGHALTRVWEASAGADFCAGTGVELVKTLVNGTAGRGDVAVRLFAEWFVTTGIDVEHLADEVRRAGLA